MRTYKCGETEIIPIEYGNSVLGEDQIFRGGSTEKTCPIVFMVYLIKAEDKLILVDAGCETMPGFDMHDFVGPVAALEEYGIKADEITDVVITHAHHDHIECVKYFGNARIYIQRDEYENGKGYFVPNMNVILFDDEMSVCKDVKAVKIGGHSIGSCIVEIGGKDDWYIISGDECYQYECLEKKIPTGCSYCPEKSREFVEKYGNIKERVLLCHEKTEGTAVTV